ncbi:VOC family protein [Vreelandella titanicae]|jgi:catechol 2,3-dioxygenase-like lactoylglutathione lyase family enzyme|uniref:VOC family protein n=1 Tax=Halomonadaceae TaxID=28256 RepID=UPI00034ACDAD|nr:MULTISPECIES: VOC family protein [Halomonas]MCE7518575.1 VOC family protein [Halomonas titanicae]NVE88589.1 VOC family protein [Halomonas titanicae]PKH61922.1 VOC family protein [Halomonas sp. Choline-3u-9]QGQ71597.1 VOC family protein [Halomonas sp. PA16-9]|tara:strand:- start:879 stop:1283 length:405 start_codon:yes stop_codon:yes gene_type:complete
MKPKISLITLGVHDLQRAIRFYREGLGLPEHETDSDEVAFFKMEGAWLSLFPREALSRDIGIADDAPSGFSGITLAHNVASQAAVDQVIEQAVAAGAELIKPGEEVFWGGYSGYFRDPEGHYWEVAYNPFMDLT